MLVDTEEQAVSSWGLSEGTRQGCPRARAFKPGEAVVTSPMKKTAVHKKGCGRRVRLFGGMKISENSLYFF